MMNWRATSHRYIILYLKKFWQFQNVVADVLWREKCNCSLKSCIIQYCNHFKSKFYYELDNYESPYFLLVLTDKLDTMVEIKIKQLYVYEIKYYSNLSCFCKINYTLIIIGIAFTW